MWNSSFIFSGASTLPPSLLTGLSEYTNENCMEAIQCRVNDFVSFSFVSVVEWVARLSDTACFSDWRMFLFIRRIATKTDTNKYWQMSFRIVKNDLHFVIQISDVCDTSLQKPCPWVHQILCSAALYCIVFDLYLHRWSLPSQTKYIPLYIKIHWEGNKAQNEIFIVTTAQEVSQELFLIGQNFRWEGNSRVLT